MIKIRQYHIIIGTVVITALVVACVSYILHSSIIKTAKQKQKDLTEKNEELVVLLKSKDRINEGLRNRISLLEEAVLQPKDHLPGDLLRVYQYKSFADVEGIGFCLAAPAHYSLTEKVKLVVDVLRKYHFKRGIMVLKSIEERAGKKIAIVELLETKKDPWAWKGGYFQGSSGGHATTYILINTFLQPEYTGSWIDGVEFYYAGKPVSNDWDHISLHGTILRKK